MSRRDRRHLDVVVILAACLLGARAVSAHHSYAMFDWSRSVTVQGIVKTVEWTSPHVWIWVAVDGGPSTPYGFEAVSPGELVRFSHWTPRSLQVGERVTVEFAPLRSGRAGGALRTIAQVDGTKLETPLARRFTPPASSSIDAKPLPLSREGAR